MARSTGSLRVLAVLGTVLVWFYLLVLYILPLYILPNVWPSVDERLWLGIESWGDSWDLPLLDWLNTVLTGLFVWSRTAAADRGAGCASLARADRGGPGRQSAALAPGHGLLAAVRAICGAVGSADARNCGAWRGRYSADLPPAPQPERMSGLS